MQCQKFNDRWTFEKVDQDDRLKALYDDDNKIIVTTIQKMNNLIKSETNLEIYNKHVVFIFDEAHRSQLGEAQKNIKKKNEIIKNKKKKKKKEKNKKKKRKKKK